MSLLVESEKLVANKKSRFDRAIKRESREEKEVEEEERLKKGEQSKEWVQSRMTRYFWTQLKTFIKKKKTENESKDVMKAIKEEEEEERENENEQLKH